MRWLGLSVIVVALASSTGLGAHPHDEDTIVMMSGTLTKVDLVRRTIELDTVDRQTRSMRNVMMFVDQKPKLKQGKRKLTLEELAAGQHVTCIANTVADQGSKLVVFEIWVNDKAPTKQASK